MDAPAASYRAQMSRVLLILHVLLAVLHLFPRLVFNPDSRAAAVVVTINSLGPGWVALFGVSSALLMLALWRQRRRHLAHLACACVWVMYAMALWLGSLLASPVGPIRFALVASVLAVIHLVVATSYADDPSEGGAGGHR
jgi:hypothetical protein